MTANYLPLAVKNIVSDLSDIVPNLSRASLLALYYDKVSSLFRLKACGDFLLTANPEIFSDGLSKSVNVYIHFLKNSKAEEKSASKCDAFFDALCIEDLSGAVEIARLSPVSTNFRKEYEEDFYFFRILMDFFALKKSLKDISPQLEEYRKLSEENPDENFDIVASLLEKNQDQFDQAISQYIDLYEERLDKPVDIYQGNVDSWPIENSISIRILAFLKMAKIQGMTISRCYKFAPDLLLSLKIKSNPNKNNWEVI